MNVDPDFAKGDFAIRYGQTLFRVSGSHLARHSPWFCAANEAQRPASLPAGVLAFFDIASIDEIYANSGLEPLRALLGIVFAHPRALITSPSLNAHFGMLYLAHLYRFDAVYIKVARVLEEALPGEQAEDWREYHVGHLPNSVANLAYESKATLLLPAVLYACAMQGYGSLTNVYKHVGGFLRRELEVHVHLARYMLLAEAVSQWHTDVARILARAEDQDYIRARVHACTSDIFQHALVGMIPNMLNFLEEGGSGVRMDEWVELGSDEMHELQETTQAHAHGVLRSLPALFRLEESMSQTESELVRNELNGRVLPWNWKLYY